LFVFHFMFISIVWSFLLVNTFFKKIIKKII
jgi:hypothetical protein